MVGYAVARSLTGPGGTPVAQPLYGCPPERRRPDGTCYRTSSGAFYSGSSAYVSGSGARRTEQRVPAGTFDRPAAGTVLVQRGGSIAGVTRGGFGAAGRATVGAHGSAF